MGTDWELAEVILAIACPMLSAIAVGIVFFNRWRRRDEAIQAEERRTGRKKRV